MQYAVLEKRRKKSHLYTLNVRVVYEAAGSKLCALKAYIYL
jgi:hypothetical protein